MSSTKPATHQEAAFLVIEGIIERLFRESGRPVSHDAISEAYGKDIVGRQILVDRQQRLSKGHTLEWLAANDVAWFDAKMSAGALASSGRYIRSRVNGKWAYAPA